jgi:hypothetical protein
MNRPQSHFLSVQHKALLVAHHLALIDSVCHVIQRRKPVLPSFDQCLRVFLKLPAVW